MNKDIRHYQAKSLRERLLFKQYLKDDLNSFNFKYTPFDSFEKHDVTFLSIKDLNFTRTISEIKVRNIKYKSTQGGFFIQKDKYDYLMAQGEKYDRIEYINIFEDGILIWDLKKLNTPTFHTEFLPTNNHSDSTKEKEVGFLFFWEADVVINKEINIHSTLKRAYEILTRIGK